MDAAMEVDPPADSFYSYSGSESTDDSEFEDSSDTDEETCIRNKLEDEDDLQAVEELFTYARDQFYKEHIRAIDKKIKEVRSKTAKEYLGHVEKLKETVKRQLEVADKRRELRLQNLKNKFEATNLSDQQDFEDRKQLLYESVKEDLKNKISRLEEDRYEDFWFELSLEEKHKKAQDDDEESKRRPKVVKGPYIVYGLNDDDIMEDWTKIKKALAKGEIRKHVARRQLKA